MWTLVLKVILLQGVQQHSGDVLHCLQCSAFGNSYNICGVKWSEVVAVGQNMRSISSRAGLQLLNVLVTLTLSHWSFNYDADHGRVWITLGDWHCGLETFMLGSRFRTHAQSIATLHAPQVRALTTYTTLAIMWSSSGVTIITGWHVCGVSR